MPKRFAFIVVIVVGSLIMSCSVGFCASQSREIETLKGIKSFKIVVAEIRPEIERDGLTKMQIITDVESKLRLAGIDIDDGPFFGLDSTVLNIIARIIDSKVCGYIYIIRISVHQPAYLARTAHLARNKNILAANASTWSTNYLGITPDLIDITNNIKDQVDNFLNDYLSANPKGETASDKQK